MINGKQITLLYCFHFHFKFLTTIYILLQTTTSGLKAPFSFNFLSENLCEILFNVRLSVSQFWYSFTPPNDSHK